MITLKDIVRLKLSGDDKVHEYLLVKISSQNRLFKVKRESEFTEEGTELDSER